ncbi:MAG: hypothetical protein ACTHJV_13830 [Rhizobiaceae bacterium]
MKCYRSVLLGSAASAALALGIVYSASAVASPLSPANSYADLLEPVENAQAVLFGDDLARMQRPDVQLVQDEGDYHHHHHHQRRYDYHHHHHHHHHGFGFGMMVVPERHCYIQRRVHYNYYGERIVRRYRVCE